MVFPLVVGKGTGAPGPEPGVGPVALVVEGVLQGVVATEEVPIVPFVLALAREGIGIGPVAIGRHGLRVGVALTAIAGIGGGGGRRCLRLGRSGRRLARGIGGRRRGAVGVRAIGVGILGIAVGALAVGIVAGQRIAVAIAVIGIGIVWRAAIIRRGIAARGRHPGRLGPGTGRRGQDHQTGQGLLAESLHSSAPVQMARSRGSPHIALNYTYTTK